MVWVAVINWSGRLQDALIETSASEEGILRVIREWMPQAEQRGKEFYNREGVLVAFYVRRRTVRLEEQESTL